MPTPIIDWPSNLRASDRSDPILIPMNRSGGRSINGMEQIISPLSSAWTWRAVFPIRNVGAARSLRVARSKLKGRLNFLRVHVCDRYRINRREIGAWSELDVESYSDTAYFDDGSGFALAQPSAPVMALAPALSHTVTVRASDFGGAMTAGVYFSIDNWLYHVDAWELVDDTYELTISPPLRAAVTTAMVADFDARSIWKVTDDQAGSVDFASGRFGAVTLVLEEAIERLLP